MIDALSIRGGDGADACPARARKRRSVPAVKFWEDTRIATIRDGKGRRTRFAYTVAHIWTTRNNWEKHYRDGREHWTVTQLGSFVLAYTPTFR